MLILFSVQIAEKVFPIAKRSWDYGGGGIMKSTQVQSYTHSPRVGLFCHCGLKGYVQTNTKLYLLLERHDNSIAHSFLTLDHFWEAVLRHWEGGIVL